MPQLADNPHALAGRVNHQPTLRNRIYAIFRTFHLQGTKTAISHYSSRALNILTRTGQQEAVCEAEVCDQRFAAVDLDASFAELAIQSPNGRWGLPYVPTKEEIFHKALESLPITAEDYHFIDLGAGKGMALLLACKYPFKSITGVEYSKTLAEAATRNIHDYLGETGSDRTVQSIWGDATDFELPDAPTILYLYNPFQGKVMDRVIENIERSLRNKPRDFWVVYGYPWEFRKFDRSPAFNTVESNSDYCIYRSSFR